MGTWTRINITGPVTVLEQVDKAKLSSRWGDYLEESADLFASSPGACITLALGSKWGIEGLDAWAGKFTSKRPGLTVSVLQEWDTQNADESGFVEDIYRGGEWIPAESKVNGEVPANLGNLLEMARFALTINDPLPAREALAALIAGLE
jgi:hypothetical protein